ncbi:MAG TPA: glycerophosphodiester phosphodiesterase [Gemmatimonadaceae bacterium]|nr:glycerophosphodiester phosphodiesterase [Gemmatimonadaceae bacterium]
MSGGRWARTQLIAHRGARTERRENTLSAFLRALELGAEAIELDVHATRDGIVVVHHDPTLSAEWDLLLHGRTIGSLWYGELSAVRFPGGERIPSLGEVLSAVDGRAETYIEIKHPGIEELVLDVVEHSPAPERCALHAFDHRVVAHALALRPDTPGGILLQSRLVDTVSALRATGARDLWQWWEQIDEALVSAVHAAGGRVIAWTVNDVATASRLAAVGVDGVCTDDVAALSTVLRR